METDILLSNIIKNQAITNIGTIGHVANGKSTLVKQMTGVKTQKHCDELERNITINLGYANCKIFYSKETNEYKCSNLDSLLDSKGNNMDLIHHISFVDCPGHKDYMQNMMCGTSVMDCAFIIEAANADTVPQAQTLEHFQALKTASNLTDIVILQNKCDLVSKSKLASNKVDIDDFIDEYMNDKVPIIPIIAQSGKNIPLIIEYLANQLGNYNRDLNKPLQMNIIRTFDINKPNINSSKLKGGVLGTSIVYGLLKKNDIIQILPGICSYKNDEWIITPIFTKVTSIYSEKKSLDIAIPGGLIGIGTTLDPSLCKSNKLVGQIATKIGASFQISTKIKIKYSKFFKPTNKLKKGTVIKIHIICTYVKATILNCDKKFLELKLATPCCINDNEKISLMINVKGTYKLFATAKIIEYNNINISVPDKYKKFISKINYKYNIINDLMNNNDNNITCKKKFYNYDKLLDKLSHTDNKINIVSLKLPKPISNFAKNGKQLVYNNFNELINTITNCNDTYSIKFLFQNTLNEELSCSSDINGKGELLINRRLKSNQLNNIIIKILSKIKRCNVCNSYQTFITKNGKLLQKNCLSCDSISSIIR
jgi:translation initiation factor 2 subunit 3